MANSFEGNVALVLDKTGNVNIRPTKTGGYSADEVQPMIDDLLESKKPLNQYSLWLDGIKATPKNDAYSHTALAAAIKAADSAELIAVRRKGKYGTYRAPVLKLTAGKTAVKSNAARIGR